MVAKEEQEKVIKSLRGRKRWVTQPSLRLAKNRRAVVGQEIERLKSLLGEKNLRNRQGRRMDPKKYKAFRARVTRKLHDLQDEHAYLTELIHKKRPPT